MVNTWLPLLALMPLHAPLAAQTVALLLQVSVTLPPELTELGVAWNVTLGPTPTTVSVKFCVASGAIPLLAVIVRG